MLDDYVGAVFTLRTQCCPRNGKFLTGNEAREELPQRLESIRHYRRQEQERRLVPDHRLPTKTKTPHYTPALFRDIDPIPMAARQKSNSALLAELKQDQLHLKDAGKLNGTTEESRARLQDAITRGFNLSDFVELVDVP